MTRTDHDAHLIDGCGRRIDYLRISVTDRCDLRCSYCLPRGFRGFVEPADWLSLDEMARLAAVFAGLGVRRVRLTGGEPLTRKGIVDLCANIASAPGIADLSLSTNGTRLAPFADGLRAAGVRRLNVSLDTLDRRRFVELTGRDALPEVLAGLEAARHAGFRPIKINRVALPGLALADVESMVEYCMSQGFILRLIEAMPMGSPGESAGYLGLAGIEAALRERHRLVPAVVAGGGPARYLRHADDAAFTIGFITPRSQHFCATCNRVRITVDGLLHLCLGHEDRLDLRALMRAGAGDADLAGEITAALMRKPARHDFEHRSGRPVRVMATTGG